MDRCSPPLILVVEDDPDLCGLYRAVFEGEGWAVATVSTPDPLTSLVGTYRPAAVVMDLHLGGCLDTGDAGIRLLRRVRADLGSTDVPVAVCSTDYRLAERHRDEIAKLGATLLPKPFDLDDLLRAVLPPA